MSHSTENQKSLTRRFKINTKQQVWQAAKECGLDEFIAAASRAFDGDIAAVKIETPEGESFVWIRGIDEKTKQQ